MIDKFFYWLFGNVDAYAQWIEKQFNKPKKKKNKLKKNAQKKLKEMNLFKSLKKEVNVGANGTQDYVIKKGINKGKIAK